MALLTQSRSPLARRRVFVRQPLGAIWVAQVGNLRHGGIDFTKNNHDHSGGTVMHYLAWICMAIVVLFGVGAVVEAMRLSALKERFWSRMDEEALFADYCRFSESDHQWLRDNGFIKETSGASH